VNGAKTAAQRRRVNVVGVREKGQVWYITTRAVKEGAEFLIDYGPGYWRALDQQWARPRRLKAQLRVKLRELKAARGSRARVARLEEEVEDLKGGVAGGSILKGVLRMNDEIEIRPGIVSKDKEGNVICKPIRSRIMSLLAEKNALQFAVPGGLIGVGTKIDPTQTRADRLVGHVLGHPGKLPNIFIEIEVKFYLLRRLLGVKTDGDSKAGKVAKLKKGEILMVNIGSTAAGGRVLGIKDNDYAKVALTNPVCTQDGDKVALSRRIDKHWRLIGWGSIVKGTTIKPVS